MGLPVFGVSYKSRGSNQSPQIQRLARILKFLPVASLDMILSSKQITKVLISLRRCAGWPAPLLFANPQRQVLLRWGPCHLQISSDAISLLI